MTKKHYQSHHLRHAVTGTLSAFGFLAITSQLASASQITVKPGDTVWGIAQQHQLTVQSIEQANPTTIKKISNTVDLIQVGQKLTLPDGQTTQPAARPQVGTYTVNSGDTLNSIAQHFNVSVNQIVAWNNLTTQQIYVGQQLTVNGATAQPATNTTTAGVTAGPVSSAPVASTQLQTTNTGVTAQAAQPVASQADVQSAVNSTNQTNVQPASTATVSGSENAQTTEALAAATPNISTSIQQQAASSAANATQTATTTDESTTVANTVTTQASAGQTVTSQVVQPSQQPVSVAPVSQQPAPVASSAVAVQSQAAPASSAAQSTASAAPTSSAAQSTTSAAPVNSSQPQQPTSQAAAQQPAANNQATSTTDLQSGSVVSLAVKIANSNSVPYVWGGNSLSGMDCSGFVDYVYAHAENKQLPHNSVALESCVNQHAVSQAQPGDILFWGQHGSTYHVAIYTGNNQYAAAAQPGTNVSVYTLSPYFAPSFAGTVK
jgi:LysM repeat protein